MIIKPNSSKIKFKIDFSKALQNIFDFNIGSAITEIFNVEENIETSAFALLFNAAHKTNVLLIKELDQEAVNKGNLLDYKLIESEWEEYLNVEIILTPNFFNNTLQSNQQYLVKSFLIFQKYCGILEIEIPENFSFIYYNTFRKNLLEEYLELPDKYSKLAGYFDNPILKENETFEKQVKHYLEIKKNFTTKLQPNVEDSNESLKDLYIAPFFQIFGQNLSGDHDENFVDPKTDIDINKFLNDFISGVESSESFREDYNMVFVLGQPGQGKTSLCYKLIYDILSKSKDLPSRPLYFIRIRDLHAKDFVNDTFSTLKKAIQQDVNFESDDCILILDGLDEAYMSGGLLDNDLKHLYERLNKACRFNRKLKLVLTSRLNYINLNDPSIEGSLVIKIDVLQNDQIREYLRKFSKFYSDNTLAKRIDEILEGHKFQHIKELLEQPVLMYFVALTNIDIEENDSKAVIYNKIFDSLAQRSWDKNGQLQHIKSELKPEKYSKYLRQYIRNLAFEIYQSPYLYITVDKLISLDSTKEFISRCFNTSLSSNSETIKEVSKYLLVSFYFQNSKKGDDGNSAIEFFHNSLWEYLTAEYMWEECKRLSLSTDNDNELQPVRLEEYYDLMKRLIGNKELKREVRKNLENIINIESEENKTKVYNQTKEVFFKLVENDMLLFYDKNTEILTAKTKMSNIFTICWTFLYRNIFTSEMNIQTNANFNIFFFNVFSDFTYQYDIKNINFLESNYQDQYITECYIENVIFDYDLIDNINLFQNTILDTTFKNYFSVGSVHHNDFENVIFENVTFEKNTSILENKFTNVKFFNCEIPSRNWIEKINKTNEVDSIFLYSHIIKEKKERYNGDKSRTRYFINYISK